MSQHIYLFEHLEIDLERGVVQGRQGEEKRLSPVNLKVLSALLEQAPAVVSRNALFDTAWPNQSVSDDTLNRAISDIRSLLSAINPDVKYIETIPKRGYRWIATRTPTTAQPSKTRKSDNTTPEQKENSYHIIKNTSIVALLVIVITVLSGPLLSSLITPTETRVALLLTTTPTPGIERSASRLESSIRKELSKNPYLSLLASGAIEAKPTSPYPYFYQRFDAKWVIEIQMNVLGDELTVRTDIVDAKTGLIQASFQEILRWPAQDPQIWRSVSFSVHTALKKLSVARP